VEVGEVVTNSLENDRLEAETVEAASKVYDELLSRIQADSGIAPKLAAAKGVSIADLEFVDIADAIAGFIRDNFAIQTTRFHEFVFSEGDLEPTEVAGGLIFYGKGRCATCHNGAYFSDLRFHSVPFPQAGFGKDGFGVDYGRFNVTMDDRDRHRFRTPPLYNVVKTALLAFGVDCGTR
jgi:cytochrome c peroxidase